MKYRGIIEGFYGQMWTHEERLHLIRNLKRWNMNLYIYAPRDDPYHRFHWEKPYPEKEMKQFAELAEEAKQHGVMFSYAISPGNSFNPNSAADHKALLGKLKPFIDMGCTFFPIFYDDLVEGFDPEGDSGVKHAEMQANVMNTLAIAIKKICPTAHFLFSPTQYMTADKSRYLCRLHELLDPDIETIVSGVDPDTDTVCPRSFSDAGAQRYLDNFGRHPFFWDNFNVRDNALTVLHWSPYSGRGENIGKICSGIIFNPQNVYLLNIPVFGTMGDFLRDPHNYDPQVSFRKHLEEFMGKEAAPLGEILSKWFTAEWFARSGDGFVSSENNLPSLSDADTMPLEQQRPLLTGIIDSLSPLTDFVSSFNHALMPPDVAACLMPYAYILSYYAQAMVDFCNSLLKQTDALPDAINKLEMNMTFIEEKLNYRLPISVTSYTNQLLKYYKNLNDLKTK